MKPFDRLKALGELERKEGRNRRAGRLASAVSAAYLPPGALAAGTAGRSTAAEASAASSNASVRE
jgi:hypothetical protein